MQGALRLTIVMAVLAVAGVARAEDPPGLARAKELVEAPLGDEHRATMRVVWPEESDAPPRDGDELVLITGYMDNTLTRFVWRDGKVEARWVYAAQSWFYNRSGESFRAGAIDVASDDFRTCWNAIRRLAGARCERVAPDDPDVKGGGMGVASHASHRFVRIASQGVGARHESVDARAPRHYPPVWDEIRDDAIFAAVEALRGERPSRDVPLDNWAPYLTTAIAEAASGSGGGDGASDWLLLSVQLRVAGEAGDLKTLEACDALAFRRATDDRDEAYGWAIDRALDAARTKLQLRLHWSLDFAKQRICRPDHRLEWRGDTVAWVRARLREREPAAYGALLVEEISAVREASADLSRTLSDLLVLRPDGAVERLRGLVESGDDLGRVRVAGALLAIDPADALAIRAMRYVAFDDQRFAGEAARDADWPRRIAIEALVTGGHLDPAALRSKLTGEKVPNSDWVHLAIAGLNVSPVPLSESERRDAWMRLLDAPYDLGVREAVTQLIVLRDRVARPGLLACLARMERDMPHSAARFVEKSRRLIEQAMPQSPAAPSPDPPPPPVRDSEPSPR